MFRFVCQINGLFIKSTIVSVVCLTCTIQHLSAYGKD